MYKKVVAFAKQKHKGQTRIGGNEYITHPLEVGSILLHKGITHKDIIHTAILHDTLEDTLTKKSEILELTNITVLNAVVTITKDEHYEIKTYLEDIKKNDIAYLVKLADRIHNLKSATVAYISFQKRYIEETEDYYIDFAKGSIFEDDIKTHLRYLKEVHNNNLKI